ncbi:MAG: DUF2892 domain-containing protein [Desulfuromonadales bacterium]
MKHNVCSQTDKMTRVVIGVVLFGLFFLEGGWAYLGLIGFIPIITAIAGYCPISQMLGVNTCRVKEHQS